MLKELFPIHKAETAQKQTFTTEDDYPPPEVL